MSKAWCALELQDEWVWEHWGATMYYFQTVSVWPPSVKVGRLQEKPLRRRWCGFVPLEGDTHLVDGLGTKPRRSLNKLTHTHRHTPPEQTTRQSFVYSLRIYSSYPQPSHPGGSGSLPEGSVGSFFPARLLGRPNNRGSTPGPGNTRGRATLAIPGTLGP